MDDVVAFLECKEVDAFGIMVNRLSKMRHSVPCNSTMDAHGLADLVLQGLVCLHALPATIASN